MGYPLEAQVFHSSPPSAHISYNENDVKPPVVETFRLPTTALVENIPAGEPTHRPWFVLFGAMCIAFTTSGYMSAWGVFQAHYEQTVLQDSSPSAIAWIGSIQQAFLYIPTLIFTRLMDMGYFRSMITTASVVLIISTFLIAQCQEYYQFLLVQGVLTGISAGVFTGPVTAIISQWFHRHRGLALGLYAAGASIGGTVFPISAKALIPLIGFSWTMRVIAVIITIMLGLGNLTIKERKSPPIVKGTLFDLSPLRSKIFVLYCFASFLVYLAYYTFTTYIAASAISVGISTGFSFYLVSICNACSGLSRATSGLIADKIGAMNLMIPATGLTVVVYCVWPCVRSELNLTFLSVFYGILIGPFASLVSSPVLDLGERDEVGRRIGILMSIVGTSMLIGAPISGAVDSSRGPIAMGIYAGSMMLFGVIIMATVRYMSGKEPVEIPEDTKLGDKVLDVEKSRPSSEFTLAPIRFSFVGSITLPGILVED